MIARLKERVASWFAAGEDPQQEVYDMLDAVASEVHYVAFRSDRLVRGVTSDQARRIYAQADEFEVRLSQEQDEINARLASTRSVTGTR